MTLGPRPVARRFLVLRALRWLPTGLMIPVLTLLLLDRGLSLAQIGLVGATQGAVVLLLELPTGGLADTLGRRPVLMAATATEAVAVIVLLATDGIVALVVVHALFGVYRALESGPLDAWYVDAALAADPGADLEAGLSRGGAVIGLAIAAGALLSGVIVATDPVPAVGPLAGPLVLLIVLRLVEVAAQWVLMEEEAPGRRSLGSSVRAVPAVIGGAVGLVRASVVLAALVGVEVLWGAGSTTFERLIAPRLADVAGGATTGAALLGPTTAAAWVLSAAGSATVPLLYRRFGSAATAAGLRVAQGLAVVGTGLAAGPAGVIVAHLATYAAHGASNPVHAGLLHRAATARQRATVLSLNSLAAQVGGAVGAIALGWLADTAGVPTALVMGGGILAAAAPLYLIAGRARPGAVVATIEPEPVG